MLAKTRLINIVKKTKNVFCRGTIKNKLIAWSIVITIVSIYALYFAFQILFHKYMIKNFVTFNHNTHNQAEKYFDNYIEKLDSYFNKIILDSDIVSCFTEPFDKQDSKKINDNIGYLDEKLNNILFNKNYVDHVVILGKNNFPYIYSWGTSGKYPSDDFSLDLFLSKNDSMSLQNTKFKLIYNGISNSNVIDMEQLNFNRYMHNKFLYIRPIYSANTEIECIVILCINPELLNDILTNSVTETTLLLDDKQQIIYTSNKLYSDKSLHKHINTNESYNIINYENQSYILTASNMDYYDFMLMSVTPIKKILSYEKSFWHISILYAVICLVFVYIIAYWFSKKITAPLHQLSNHLNSADSIPDKIEHVNKIKKSFSLKVKLLLYFVISTLLPILIFGVLQFFAHYNAYNNYITQLATNNMHQAEKNLDNLLESFDEFTIGITYNDIIQDALHNKHISERKTRSNLTIDKLIADIKYTNREFVSLKLYDINGHMAYSSMFFDYSANNILSSSLLNTANNTKGQLIFVSSNEKDNKNATMSFLRQVKSKKEHSFSQVIGYLAFYAEHNMLNNIIQDIRFEKSGYVYLMDKNNHILDHYYRSLSEQIMASDKQFGILKNKKSGRFTTVYDNEKFLILFNTTKVHDLKVIAVVPYRELNKKMIPVLQLCALIFIACIIVVFLISSLIAYQIIHPLHHLQQLMLKVSDNQLDIHMTYTKNDEIGILTTQFNNMIDRLNKLIYENYQTKLKQQELMFLEKEAQLNALQQQINPHFLYNTLESINWMAYKCKAFNICDMVTALGDFFRGSITKSKDFITFEEEIEHLKNYIYIQQIRYQGRFTIEWDINQEVTVYKTVKLILQPIVENAIVHGIDNLQSGGYIKIQGYMDNSKIHFNIIDNGTGILKQDLERLRNGLTNPSANEASVGIFNVYRRLQLYFDKDFVFNINSEVNKGTTVSFSIPALK
ncbi:MAG: sensor histidine kinase [Vallitalea sp.]|jgi:two-component system sensor histidine kinase YesM|nr:sensor histidine kinase [Vallitalea sp.]